jgi:hypothetical protein
MGDVVFVKDGRLLTNSEASRCAYQDPIRKGHWLVDEGVRYVAVEGVPEGQRWTTGADAVASALNSNAALSIPMEWYRRATARWAVIDLHDLGPENAWAEREGAVMPAKAEPRYQVRTAEEMRGMEGRRCRQYGRGTCVTWTTEMVRAEAAKIESGEKRMTVDDWYPWGGPSGFPVTHAIIDTQDGWGQAKTPEYTGRFWVLDPQTRSFTLTDPPEPKRGPSDAEIVDTWDMALRNSEIAGAPFDQHQRSLGLAWGDYTATWEQYQAARSRELRKRVRAGEEAKRVPIRGDDADDVAGDVVSLSGLMDPFGREWK